MRLLGQRYGTSLRLEGALALAVANGVVYIGSFETMVGRGDSKVFAINATTGTEVWNFTSLSDVKSAPRQLQTGLSMSGMLEEEIFAINATTRTRGMELQHGLADNIKPGDSEWCCLTLEMVGV